MSPDVANELEPSTGLKKLKALASGQHGGSAMASRSKRDSLTLAAEPGTATPQPGRNEPVCAEPGPVHRYQQEEEAARPSQA